MCDLFFHVDISFLLYMDADLCCMDIYYCMGILIKINDVKM